MNLQDLLNKKMEEFDHFSISATRDQGRITYVLMEKEDWRPVKTHQSYRDINELMSDLGQEDDGDLL